MKLVPMDNAQFENFREVSCAMYAHVSPYYRDLPYATALELIKNDFNTRIAPEGFMTSDQFFLAIMKGAEQIGYFHFSEFPKGTKFLFGWNFHIFESYQKKGLGYASAKLAQDFFKDKGYTKIAINVVANNSVAIKIYESLGFQITQFNMEGHLT